MRYLVAFVVASIALVSGPDVLASPVPRLADVIRAAGEGDLIVPPEWDGLWSYVDSVYTCEGEVLFVSSGVDTLCGGQAYSNDPGSVPPDFSCTGTADATTLQFECSGSMIDPSFPECEAVTSLTSTITRTGDTYTGETQYNVTYPNSPFCELFPTCLRIVSHATRTGPAPPEYCSTPVRSSSFGELKIRYR